MDKLQRALDMFEELRDCKDYHLQSNLYDGIDVADAYMEGQIVISLLQDEIKTLKTRLGVSERELFKYQGSPEETNKDIEFSKNLLMRHQQSEI